MPWTFPSIQCTAHHKLYTYNSPHKPQPICFITSCSEVPTGPNGGDVGHVAGPPGFEGTQNYHGPRQSGEVLGESWNCSWLAFGSSHQAAFRIRKAKVTGMMCPMQNGDSSLNKSLHKHKFICKAHAVQLQCDLPKSETPTHTHHKTFKQPSNKLSKHFHTKPSKHIKPPNKNPSETIQNHHPTPFSF